jgi:hypothetical protein
MFVEILIADRYLDHTNRAINCKVGDTLETQTGYGQTLIQAGLAKPVHPPKLASEPTTASGGKVEVELVAFNIARLSIPAILEMIQAGDLTPERAMEMEQARGDSARPTLIEGLEKIIGDDGGDE